MIRKLLAAAAAIALIASGMPSVAAPSSAGASKTGPSRESALEIPSEIRIPSSVGEVVFHHQMHIKDLGVKCGECHHQINAKPLSTPHPDYFGSSWINCKACHGEAEKVAQKAYRCSECHETRPKNITDETLSAKVVIHKKCWTCHAAAPGKEASEGCAKCHSGKKRS